MHWVCRFHYSCAPLSALLLYRKEYHETTGVAFGEVVDNPIDGVEMQWLLQWKIEESQSVHTEHYLSLALEIEILELLIEKPGDIWVSLDSLHLSFESESENNTDTKRVRQLFQEAHSTAPVKLSMSRNDYKVYILHPNYPQDNTSCILPMRRVCLSDLPDGSLTCSLKLLVVFCTIDFVNKSCILHRFPQCDNKVGAMLTCSEDDSKGKCSDVTLIATASSTVDDASTPVKFFAHKVILAAHSPVFARMFEHDMKEGDTNEVIITDVSPDILQEMLTFMYTNSAPNIHRIGQSLLYVADKYQVDELVARCEHILSYNITVENSIDLLLCAQAHNAPKLRENVIQYIAKHGEEVTRSENWDKVKQQAELLDELIQTIYQVTEPVSKKQKFRPVV